MTAAVYLLLALVYVWVFDLHKLFRHRCSFRVLSAYPGASKDGYQVTAILKMCKCGEHRSEIIQGWWTEEQLKPKENDAEFLKRVGVKA